jgi:threonine dehydrogenase-like Zn-dependent dehydrogenase
VPDRSTAETVTIIGAGIGGLYLVGELGVAGFKLRLHDIDDSRLSEIRAHGGVDVEGENGGFAAVERATSDLGSAVDGADIIIVVTAGRMSSDSFGDAAVTAAESPRPARPRPRPRRIRHPAGAGGRDQVGCPLALRS